MNDKTIKRYVPEKLFDNIKEDFAFLVEEVVNSQFEYDFQLRATSFNLYYKGNSLGKISYGKRNSLYTINVHTAFVTEKMRRQFGAKTRASNDYLRFNIPAKQLRNFYSKSNLSIMSQKVKQVNYQEEIIFEQSLITDNIHREDIIIIDRQVREPGVSGRMDLLALILNGQGIYQFCVLEVKLGNNRELEGSVVDQIDRYIKQINDNFKSYKASYEVNYKQKRELGLFKASATTSVTISLPVCGAIVVIGYPGKAKENIAALKTKLQRTDNITLIQFRNLLDVSKILDKRQS